jgi:regulator of protease activity HflC (stomatin/prohibitin superfamily)
VCELHGGAPDDGPAPAPAPTTALHHHRDNKYKYNNYYYCSNNMGDNYEWQGKGGSMQYNYSTSERVPPASCCFPCCCVQMVKQGTVGVVETMGGYSHIINPGCSWVWYPCQNVAGTLSTRVQQLDVVTDTKTSDNVTMKLKIAVQYEVMNEYLQLKDRDSGGAEVGIPDMARGAADEDHGIYRAFYKLTDIRRQLTPYVEDVVRSEIPKRKLDEAYESKEAVAHAVQDALSHEMQQYGYRIVNTLVTDLIPDANVMRAMNDIETQRRERMAATEKAEAKKVLVVKAAEAEMEAKHLSGQGVAKQRQAIVDGLKNSVLEFNEGVVGTTPADVMQLMMVTQYLDMLKDVGGKGSTVFIPHGPGAVSDVQGQMRQGFMEANTLGTAAVTAAMAQPATEAP